MSLQTGRGGNHNDSAFLAAKGDEAFLNLIENVHGISDLGMMACEYLLGRA